MKLVLTDSQVPQLPDIGSLGGHEPLPLRAVLRAMAMSREGDRREGVLLRQGKGWFQVAGTGHEALAAAVYALRPDDWLFPYYRDRPLAVARGVTTSELALGYFAKAGGSGAGTQMPSHFCDPRLGIFPVATPTAAQSIPAVGAAWGFKLSGTERIVLTTIGDASTRQGEFYEALAFALQERLPCVFVVEDNRYGISTRTETMTPFRIGALDPHCLATVDGRDPEQVYAAACAAVDRARSGAGPTVIWCDLDRLCSHTSSDDQRVYRTAEDLALDLTRDPIEAVAARLIERGEMTRAEWEADLRRIAKEIDETYQAAESAPDPNIEMVTSRVFGPAADPDSIAAVPMPNGEEQSIVSAVNLTLAHALRVNDRVILFGEDLEDPKGGVFGVTKGLSTQFPGRVVNSPLAEATIIGAAVGLAAQGYLPIVEIQFIDFITPGLNQLIQQAATLRYRSAGQWTCPMVLIAPYGAYLPGGGIWHSESNDGLWAHIHGLRVAIPSTPTDASGLLWTAIHGNDPALILLPKHVFRKRAHVGDEIAAVPLGKAAVRREGSDVTVVSWGNCLEVAEQAMDGALATEGISAELIDLRTICPCDYEAVAMSVAKTGRLVVVHEDGRTTGFGQAVITEIVARPAWFNTLYSAPQLVARGDSPIPFNPALEYAALPSAEQVADAVRVVMA